MLFYKKLVFLFDLGGRPESRRVDLIRIGRPKKNVDPKNVVPKKDRSIRVLMDRP